MRLSTDGVTAHVPSVWPDIPLWVRNVNISRLLSLVVMDLVFKKLKIAWTQEPNL